MTASFSRFVLWLIIALMIVASGWNKPLRYRFMSAEQIAEAEHANDPEPPPVRLPARPTPYVPRGTSLDLPAGNRH